MEAGSAGAEAADIPIHVLGRYKYADGGVINPVGVLDSSLDTEAVSHEPAAEDSDDAELRATAGDANLPSAISASVLNSATAAAAYSPPRFSCLTSCSMFLRGLRGQFWCFCSDIMCF